MGSMPFPGENDISGGFPFSFLQGNTDSLLCHSSGYRFDLMDTNDRIILAQSDLFINYQQGLGHNCGLC
jgi:hypothetical protein